jgi:hypothetical protein
MTKERRKKMASTFQVYRFFVTKEDVSLPEEMRKDIEAYGNSFFAVDGDVAVSVQEHKGDYVFCTVGLEMESSGTVFTSFVREHVKISERTSGTLVVEPVLE